MAAVYADVPHEEAFLRSQFGEAFDDYCDRVPRVVPLLTPMEGGTSVWKRGRTQRREQDLRYVCRNAGCFVNEGSQRVTAGPGPATLRLSVALVATALVALLEFWGGAASRSLALTGDAVHVCMDVVALALALIAGVGAARPADTRRTFGYGRIEVLGALVNGTLLLVATIAIVYFAARRSPRRSSRRRAHGGRRRRWVSGQCRRRPLSAFRGQERFNVRAVLFHVMGDALGAFAVIFGGIAIALTHFAWIDPLLSLFVAAIIVVGVSPSPARRDRGAARKRAGRRRQRRSREALQSNRWGHWRSRPARVVDRQWLACALRTRLARRSSAQRSDQRAPANRRLRQRRLRHRARHDSIRMRELPDRGATLKDR